MAVRRKPSKIVVHDKTFDVYANNTGRKFTFDIYLLEVFKGRAWDECGTRGYLHACIGGIGHVYAHHIVIGCPLKGYCVDHIDRDITNNLASNLRVVSYSQNHGNKTMLDSNTSGYKGVSWRKDRKKWRAYIKHKGKFISLGHYDNPIDAALAYDNAALEYYEECALTNKKLGLI
ncbi:MAG: hypothetical protein PWQ37_2861 [Candidatus Petromonas sp.]|nr:hypothetical protein [Candidatus Petromonas sp.]